MLHFCGKKIARVMKTFEDQIYKIMFTLKTYSIKIIITSLPLTSIKRKYETALWSNWGKNIFLSLFYSFRSIFKFSCRKYEIKYLYRQRGTNANRLWWSQKPSSSFSLMLSRERENLPYILAYKPTRV